MIVTWCTARYDILWARPIRAARSAKDTEMPKGNYDHAGATCHKGEMMKAWDGPGEQGKMAAREGREAGKVAGHGGMKKEAGASDPGELK